MNVEILVVGAGLAGVATAYHLCTRHRKTSVLLVDPRAPLSLTSAQSGDNYRNWWPHPTMTQLTNDSIDLMEQIAATTANVIHMTRRGYLLATREEEIDDLIASLEAGYRPSPADDIRVHRSSASAAAYVPSEACAWNAAPTGVDVVSGRALVRRWFPALSADVANVLHVRRAGDVSGQQLGQHMLERIAAAGGRLLSASVRSIHVGRRFLVGIEAPEGAVEVGADVVVDAAGPFAADVAAMMGVALPILNVHQQKIVFEDTFRAIPRSLPFSVDLDPLEIAWTDEERALLSQAPATEWLTGRLPGGAHCRPEGGSGSRWVKLGWAFNRAPGAPQPDGAADPGMHPQFPEIVMRAVSRLVPSLRAYVDRLPRRLHHYGGYYSMTPENWPLVGPLGVDGAFVTAALSGFGTMSACAAGALCADWIAGSALPAYAAQLSPARYADQALIAALTEAPSKGLL